MCIIIEIFCQYTVLKLQNDINAYALHSYNLYIAMYIICIYLGIRHVS